MAATPKVRRPQKQVQRGRQGRGGGHTGERPECSGPQGRLGEGEPGHGAGEPGAILVAGHVVLVLELVPALNLLVLVLQTLVPMFQALSLGRDAQLAASWGTGAERGRGQRGGFWTEDCRHAVSPSRSWASMPHGWVFPCCYSCLSARRPPAHKPAMAPTATPRCLCLRTGHRPLHTHRDRLPSTRGNASSVSKELLPSPAPSCGHTFAQAVSLA